MFGRLPTNPSAPMKSDVLRKRFMDTAVADVLRAVDGGAIIGSTCLAICVLDYLAYLRPIFKPIDQKNRANYKAIVGDFLARVDSSYKPTEIWALRCALVHAYAQSQAMKTASLVNFQMTYGEPGIHLRRTDGVVALNLDTFVADVIWVARNFFVDTTGDPSVEAQADSLLCERSTREGMVAGYTDDAVVATRTYESMHRALRELDAATPELDRLRADVTKIYPNISTEAPA